MNIFQRLLNRIRFKRTIKRNESTNVVNGIAKARKLYKELILKVHPDRNQEQKEIAEELIQRINENKYNYEALLLLKQEIEEKLE
mgnify:FL=1